MSRDTIRLPHDAYRLLQTLRAAGHSAYVVGGCVRDSLLGRLPGDWDICTSARPDEMKALFCSQRLILTGEKHGTVAVILHGKPYEMTTYRLDGSYRDHRHPDNVQFVDDLAADLDAHANTPEVAARRADVAAFERRMNELAKTGCYTMRQLAVNGADLMDIGIPAGPGVGATLQTLLNDVMEGTLPNEREALLAAAVK